jgi:hypothetical protein
MDLLNILVNFQFVILSLGLSAIVFVFRTALENALPRLLACKLWTDLLLPIVPILFGAGLGMFASVPELIKTNCDRLLFGAIAGLLSGLLYRVVKKLLDNQSS